MHLTAPSHWSRSVGTGGRDASERVGAITGMRTDGQRVFFKIDYFDESLSYHSLDPADPSVTKRVITIMLAEEY